MPNYYHEPLLFITCVGTAVVVVNMCYYFSWCVDDSIIDDSDGIPSKSHAFLCFFHLDVINVFDNRLDYY